MNTLVSVNFGHSRSSQTTFRDSAGFNSCNGDGSSWCVNCCSCFLSSRLEVHGRPWQVVGTQVCDCLPPCCWMFCSDFLMRLSDGLFKKRNLLMLVPLTKPSGSCPLVMSEIDTFLHSHFVPSRLVYFQLFVVRVLPPVPTHPRLMTFAAWRTNQARIVHQVTSVCDDEFPCRFSKLVSVLGPLAPTLPPVHSVGDFPRETHTPQFRRRASPWSQNIAQIAGSLSLRATTRLYPSDMSHQVGFRVVTPTFLIESRGSDVSRFAICRCSDWESCRLSVAHVEVVRSQLWD